MFKRNPAIAGTFFLAIMFLMTDPGAGLMAQQVLTLTDALEIAMKQSPRIRHSRISLERSEANLRAANARLKSRFSLSIAPINYSNSNQFNDIFSTWYRQETMESYGTFRIDQPVKWTDGTLSLINRFSWKDSYSEYTDESSETYSNNLYIQFQQPIFTYNRTKMDLRTLELELENSQLAYALEKLAIEKSVMERFYAVYETKMRLEIAVEEYKNNEVSYEISKNKVDAGIASLEELYQAELNMANARSSLQNQKVSLEDAHDLFKQLLGIPLDDDIEISADITYKNIAVDLQTAIANGLRHRAELRQRQIAIENAENALVRAGTKNEFLGNISLSYGSIGTNEVFRELYDAPDKNQQVSVMFEMPIWDWGEKKAEMRASQASLESNRLSLEQEKDNILISIRQAYRNLENQMIQIDIARQNVRRSQLTYEINLEKYRNGDLSSYQLNQFQTQLSETRLNEVSALIKYKQYILDMKIQSLWDFELNKSLVTD
ncbi:MAG: TolC family protein [Candidatus Krumholzibacteriota bacterium]|nr:TolC family protein [Candidatus Krumholzibacteriota bacterium]